MSEIVDCTHCKGKGFVRGVFTAESPCFECFGAGLVHSDQTHLDHSMAVLELRSRLNKAHERAEQEAQAYKRKREELNLLMHGTQTDNGRWTGD